MLRRLVSILAILLGVGLLTGCSIPSRQPAVPSSYSVQARPLGISNARFFTQGDPAPMIAEARQAIERTPPYRR